MLNDTSSTLALLASRRSGRPRDMVGPAPSQSEIETILGAGARTPDHGKLFPWRFVVVGDDQRGALEALLLKALPEHDPEANDAHRAKAVEFAHQAPALIVLVSAAIPGHKIPLWEQELSCGAAAMNMLLAAHALGYVGGWITGWAAYSERVRAAFCGPGERIAGFLFFGKPGNPLEERPRPSLSDVARRWSPPEG